MSSVTFGPFWHASTESRLRALNLFQVLRGRLLCVPKISLGQDQSTAVERVSRYRIEWTWVKLSKFMFKAFASWTSQWCTKLSPRLTKKTTIKPFERSRFRTLHDTCWFRSLHVKCRQGNQVLFHVFPNPADTRGKSWLRDKITHFPCGNHWISERWCSFSGFMLR